MTRVRSRITIQSSAVLAVAFACEGRWISIVEQSERGSVP